MQELQQENFATGAVPFLLLELAASKHTAFVGPHSVSVIIARAARQMVDANFVAGGFGSGKAFCFFVQGVIQPIQCF